MVMSNEVFKKSISLLVIFAFILSATEQSSSFYNVNPAQNHLRAPATATAKEATQYNIKRKLTTENIKFSSAGHSDEIAKLIKELGDEERIVNLNAIEALAEIGKPAIPALIEALKDGDSNVRSNAAKTLGKIGPAAKDAVPALIYALGDDKESVSDNVYDALRKIGTSVIPELIKALGSTDDLIRLHASIGIGRRLYNPNVKDAVPVLLKVLGDENKFVRWATVDALGNIGPATDDIIPALIKTLGDESSRVVRATIEALTKIGKPAIPALIDALADESVDIRRLAIQTIGEIGPDAQHAISALIIKALADEDVDVRSTGRRAFDKITPDAKGHVLSFLEVLEGKQAIEANDLLLKNNLPNNESTGFIEAEDAETIPVSLEICIAKGSREGIKSYGSKAIRLGDMIKLGLPVPAGIVIPIDATDKTINDSIDAIISYFEERHQGKLGDKKNPIKLSVRSSPVHSMPGLLFTETDVDSRQKLVKAIGKVRKSWQNLPIPVVKDPTVKGIGIVIQVMVYGDQNDNSASGVVFTRDTITGEDKLSGRFAVRQKGDNIVSRSGIKTQGMDDFKVKFPAVFAELENIKNILEKRYYYPQEIEFVIEDGRLWILQSRNAVMFPEAETKAVVDMANAGIISQFRMSTILMATQHELQTKPIFKLKDKSSLQKIGSGIPVAPGALVGEVVFSIVRAVEFSRKGKTPIFFAFAQPEEIKYAILKGDIGGIVACHGHDALHESVLAKKQGVPFIDGLNNAVFSNGILKIGKNKLQEGAPVIIDGTTGDIYLAPAPHDSALFEHSHSISIMGQDFDIDSVERQVFEQHIDDTYFQLIKLHTLLVIMLKSRTEVTPESVLDSIKAHVIHKLIFDKTDGKSERDVLLDLKSEMDSQLNLIRKGVDAYLGNAEIDNATPPVVRDHSVLVDALNYLLRNKGNSEKDVEYILKELCGLIYDGSLTAHQLQQKILEQDRFFDWQQIQKVILETNCTGDGYRVLRRPLIKFLRDFGGEEELAILNSCPRIVKAYFYIGTYTVDGPDVEREYYVHIGSNESEGYNDYYAPKVAEEKCEDPLWVDIQKAKEKIQARLAKESHKTSSAGSLNPENTKRDKYLAEEEYLAHTKSSISVLINKEINKQDRSSSAGISLEFYQNIAAMLTNETQNIESAELQGIKDAITSILGRSLSIQQLAGELMGVLSNYERESGYDVNNIRKYEAEELWGIKQIILSLDIFYKRVFPIIENMQIEESQKRELADILEYLIADNLSDMKDGKKSNPIHHNVQVLENMLAIASGLNMTDKTNYNYEWIKNVAALALLHDIGNAKLPKGTVKVKDSEIQDAILEDLPDEIRGAVKSETKTIAYAIEYRESNGYSREKVIEMVRKAIAFRRAHMISGSKMIRQALSKLNGYFNQDPYNYGRDVFSEDSINEICRVVGIHDNPSIASYFEKYGVYIETGESAGKYLFEDNDLLALAMRDADRLWMVSPEGLEKDLIDDIKSKKLADPKGKLGHNISRFEEEKASYKAAGKKAAFLDDDLLFRTKEGNKLFDEFKSYWNSRIASLKSSSAGTALSHLSDYDAERLLAGSLLDYKYIGTPAGIIDAPNDSQAIIIYSDSLKESPALQNIIRLSAGDTRKFYLVNKEEGISADELLSSLSIERDIFQRHVFNQNSLTADQLALNIAGFLHANSIKQGRVFAGTEEDLSAWSKQGLIEALVMLLKDKRFEIISDYSQQHMEYIRTHAQALIAA